MSLLFINRTYGRKRKVLSKMWLNIFERATSNKSIFVDKQSNLLKMEELSEININKKNIENIPLRSLKRNGKVISNLVINSLNIESCDKSLATFCSKLDNKHLPSNVLTTGNTVKMLIHDGKKISNDEYIGVVREFHSERVSIEFDSLSSQDALDCLKQNENLVSLIRVATPLRYKRMMKALNDIKNYSNGPAQQMIDVMYGNATPLSHEFVDVTFHNNHLNESQRQFVHLALSQQELAIVHGPPGTGKTTTIAEIIAQLVTSGNKVLACAPTNAAVDELLKKLSVVEIEKNPDLHVGSDKRNIILVRAGLNYHVFDPKLKQFHLESLMLRHSSALIIQDVQADIDRIQKTLERGSKFSSRINLLVEKKSLMAELTERQTKAASDIMRSADVVLATNTDGMLRILKEELFDVVIIDDCGQELEAICSIPLLMAKKCVLSGDHFQPPVVYSNKAATEGLSVNILERLIKLHGNQVAHLLTQQYNSHPLIMNWVSEQLYEGKLSHHESTENALLCNLPNVKNTKDTNSALLLIDTAGCSIPETESDENNTNANEIGVKAVYTHVSNLVKAGLDPEEIIVLSSCELQAKNIRQIFYGRHLRVKVVFMDNFSFLNKEAVVLSLLCPTTEKDVDFLSNKMLNAAVTSARRHLAVVCNSKTVSRNVIAKSLLRHITDHGEVRKASDCSGFNEKENNRIINSSSVSSKQDKIGQRNSKIDANDQPQGVARNTDIEG